LNIDGVDQDYVCGQNIQQDHVDVQCQVLKSDVFDFYDVRSNGALCRQRYSGIKYICTVETYLAEAQENFDFERSAILSTE
jgi:hypothetical protein